MKKPAATMMTQRAVLDYVESERAESAVDHHVDTRATLQDKDVRIQWPTGATTNEPPYQVASETQP